MRRGLLFSVFLLLFVVVGCGSDSPSAGDTGNTGDTVGDTGNTGNTVGDTGNTGNTVGDTGNSGDTVGDTGNTGNTVGDTGNSGDTGNTGNSGDTGNTANTADTANSGDTAEDLCPDDPDKTEPGACGCGVPEIDVDHDGVCDTTAYRIIELVLLDPHVKISATGLGVDCVDKTNDVNNELRKTMTEADKDDSTKFKTSILLSFSPLYQHEHDPLTAKVYMDGDCTNQEPWQCQPGEKDPKEGTYLNTMQGTTACLAPVPGTNSYDGINTPMPPCFASTGMEVTFPISGMDVTMQETQVSAFYDGEPASALKFGLMRGFVAEDEIENVTIPDDTPIIGGRKISTILPGGKGCPCGPSEADNYNGKKGWWFYFNYLAVRVDFTQPDQ